MKKFLFTFILLLAAISCSKESVEKDNDNPLIYIPHYGFSINNIWELDGGSDSHYLTVYCSGLYNGAGKDISVGYSIDASLISDYNNDETQTYSGMVEELPSDCYTMNGSSAIIKKGESEIKIPITFNANRIKQVCTNTDKYYAIPVKLNSSSQYILHTDPAMTKAIYGIDVKRPVFYFYDNRNGVAIKDKKVTYGVADQKQRYVICCEGVPNGNYNMDIAYDPDALSAIVPSGNVLPQNCFEIINSNIKFETIFDKPEVEISFNPENMIFREIYYLPLSIKNTSAYKPDDEKSTLVVKVEIKNELDKTYISKQSIHSETSSRTGAYEVEKSLSSYEKDIVELQVATNATIAGAGATGTSTTYNNKYMRLKIIPTENKAKYGVKMILVTDKSKTNNSPATLELDPDSESYYNWNLEEFVLNYRWKHTDGKYINVSEILSAK